MNENPILDVHNPAHGLHWILTVLTISASCLHAATLSFESPVYSVGDLNAGGGTNTALPFPDTNQDGWSNAGGSRGTIAPESANGQAGSGQFLTVPTPSTAGANVTMIAARKGGITVAASNSISFDLRLGSGASQNTVGFVRQFNADGTYNQNANTGLQLGQLTATTLGVRRSGFGTTQTLFSTTASTGIVQMPSASVVAGNWYRVDVLISDVFEINPGELGHTVTMSLFDYANNTTLGSNSWNGSLGISFGGVSPQDSAGIMARVQRLNADDDLAGGLDNISFTVIPEPSSAVLSCLGLLGLASIRRRLPR
jgi:hypothetical protein